MVDCGSAANLDDAVEGFIWSFNGVCPGCGRAGREDWIADGSPMRVFEVGGLLDLVASASDGFPAYDGIAVGELEDGDSQRFSSAAFDDREMIVNAAGFAKEPGVEAIAIDVDDHGAHLQEGNIHCGMGLRLEKSGPARTARHDVHRSLIGSRTERLSVSAGVGGPATPGVLDH